MIRKLITSINKVVRNPFKFLTLKEFLKYLRFITAFIFKYKRNKKKLILENAFFYEDYLYKILPEKNYYLKEFKKIFYSNNPFIFAKKDERVVILETINKEFLDFKNKVIAQASAVLKNEYNIMRKEYKFSIKVDWFYSLFRNFIWPLKRSSEINWFVNNKEDIDIKFALRLNYHQEFITLGLAYYLTNEEKYTNKFLNLILDWIKKNPPNWGINWIDSLEISHRIVCWIFALSFFIKSDLIRTNQIKMIARSLFLQVYFVNVNFNKHRYNHTIGESFAIFLFSKIFQSVKLINTFYKKYKKILLDQIKRQTQTDGVNIEQTSNYHRLVLEIFSLLYIIDKEAIFSSNLRLIEKMFEFWQYLIKPDCSIPLIGDSDDSHFIPLILFSSEEKANIELLNLGAILFNRSDFKIKERLGKVLILLLLGTQKYKEYQKMIFTPSKEKIKYFEKSGYFIGKSNWTDKANYLFFDMGHFGPYTSNHDHSDISNIIFSFKGKPILIDSGTYMYNIKDIKRNIFRSSKAHNILSINGKNQATILKKWNWENIPEIKRKVVKYDRFFKIFIEHNGYEGFLSRRQLKVNQNNLSILEIVETITPVKLINEEINISIYFHFPLELKIDLFDNYAIIDSNLKLELLSNNLSIDISKNNYPYSPYYGIKNNSQLIEFKTKKIFSRFNPLKIKYKISALNEK